MTKHAGRRRRPMLFCIGLLLLLALPARAEPLDPESVGEFFDAAFVVQRQEQELAGVVVSVVHEGDVLFKKGYGFADVDARVPADPDLSLFRIASITKTFVWTAVMQLVERGELDLGADVADYLDFPIPRTFEKPITLEHLLTHSPGFEESGTGRFCRKAEEVIPLGEYLAGHMPARVRPPGKFSAYSNYGAALAGYIVECASGLPWDRYIEENILTPLGMESTNLRQPMPETLEPRRAKGYKYVGGRFVAQDFMYSQEAPAGIISTTAADMATFMIAHLQKGSFGEARILEQETAERMHSELFRHHPTANPFLHGFYREDRNGVEIFGHGGDVNQFHSQMSLFPEHRLGVFVSYNSDPGSAARSNVIRGFVERFFPTEFPPAIDGAADVDLADYAGQYASLRRAYTTFEKMAMLVSTLRITASDDDQLMVGGRDTSRWVPLGDDVFRGLYTQTRLSFRRDAEGTVTHAFFSTNPTAALDRLSWHQEPSLHGKLFGFVGIVALLAIVGYAFRVFRRARDEKRLPFGHVLAAWIMSALGLYYLVGLYQALAGSYDEFAFGIPGHVARLLTLGSATALLAVVVFILSAIQWIGGKGGVLARVRYSVVALSGLTLLWLLWFWNALGYYL